MDIERLEAIIEGAVVEAAKGKRHDDLPALFRGLGLPEPGKGGSKAEKAREAYDTLTFDGKIELAGRYAAKYSRNARERNDIQEILWEGDTSIEMHRRCRREIADAIGVEDLYLDHAGFDRLMEALWVLEDEATAFMAAFVGRPDTSSLRYQI